MEVNQLKRLYQTPDINALRLKAFRFLKTYAVMLRPVEKPKNKSSTKIALKSRKVMGRSLVNNKNKTAENTPKHKRRAVNSVYGYTAKVAEAQEYKSTTKFSRRRKTNPCKAVIKSAVFAALEKLALEPIIKAETNT